MMDGDAMRAAMGNFLRFKKFIFGLIGPGEGGGLRARASLIILSATDPRAMPTLVARRGLVLQAALRPGAGGGLGGVTTLVTIMEEVE